MTSFEKFGLVILIVLLTGCANAPLAPGPTTTIEPTRAIATLARASTPIQTSRQRVEIAMFGEQGNTAISAIIASTATVRIAFRPYQHIEETRSDGSTNRYETEWKDHSITEMRYCVGTGRTCALPNEWKPFANEVRTQVIVNWVGLRDYGVTAQFRNTRGEIVYAGFNMLEIANAWMSITGMIDDKTPVAAQPAAIQTIIAQAHAEFPVSGKVQVGEHPMVGGKAGSTLDLKVKFEATSPRAQVTEMRTKISSMGRCLTPEEMSDALWNKFVAEKNYPVGIAINWQTFKLHVQYRDAQGNLSPVYCGEVAIEGAP